MHASPARQSRLRPIAYGASAIAVLVALGVTATVTTQGDSPRRAAIPTSVQTTATPGEPASSSPRPTTAPSATSRPVRTFSAAQLAKLPEGALVHTVIGPFGVVTVYKIKPGDTLWDIARTFAVAGVDKTLYEWNRSVIGQDPNLIHPGTLVIVDPTGKVTTDKIRQADSGQPR